MKPYKKMPIHNNQLTLIIMIILVTSTIYGCKKFVEVPPPTTQLVTPTVFASDGTATSSVTVIYAKMFSNSASYTVTWENGLLADELTSYSSGTSTTQYYMNAMTASPNNTFGFWTSAYNYIYQANAVISGLSQYKGTSPAVNQQLKGEAYFIRSFWFFYLINCYGDVPLTTTTDYTVNESITRSPRVQVLQQIISDLKTANNLLNSNYIDVSDTTSTSERTRPNKATALALLARAYLYMADYSKDNSYYAKADSAATAVIGNPTYSLCTNLSGPNSVFLANSTEAIWQLATPLPARYNTVEGLNFILKGAPGTNHNTISSQLLGSFEANDQRKTNWIGSIAAGGTIYYFPYKYKVPNGVTTVSEYTMVLRLAEQYLIRAEARLFEGNTSGALADLNVIRNRAGLPNYGGAQDQPSILAAILHERQVELFTEWGQRWFDLNRTNNTNSVMGSPGNVCALKGGTWNSNGYQELYPIPLSDIIKDSHLTQNPGY